MQHSRSVAMARWTGMGELALRQRSLKAASARWTMMASYYQSILKLQQGRLADALRLTAMAADYQNIDKARHLIFALPGSYIG